MTATEGALPLPPYNLMEFTGGPDYERIGNEFFGYLVNLAGLSSNHSVLDIGSGCGRIAAPLTTYLTSGSYEGFEISPEAVAWCEEVITSRFPNFRFHAVDVYNGCYNRGGSVQPAEFRFPFNDSSFDLAVAVSVFTHMMPNDIGRYLNEAGRVLRPGGKLLATFFLLTEWKPLLGERRFSYGVPGGSTVSKQSPEEAIAMKPRLLRKHLKDSKLVIERLEEGQWHGKGQRLTFQDLVICSRTR